MNISYRNTYMIDTKKPAGGIRDLKNAGIQNLMLCIVAWLWPPEDDKEIARWEKKKTVSKREEPETIKERYPNMIDDCRKNGIGVPVLSAPRFSRKKDKPWLQNYITEVMLESIAFCKRAGCNYLIVGMPEEDKDNIGFYKKLAVNAKQAGVCILLVNQAIDLSGHFVRGDLCEPQAVVELIDRLNHNVEQDVFGFALTLVCATSVEMMCKVLSIRLGAGSKL